MKSLILSMALAGLGVSAAVPAAASPLRVVTTTTDLAAITRAVGGAEVEVESLCRGDEDPHYLAAKPSLSRKLRNADLLVYVGLELEIGWLPLLVQAARNPSLAPGRLGSLAASAGIAVLEVPAGPVSRAEGDVHPLGNPHYWLDPQNGRTIARTIAARLGALRPEARGAFTAHLGAFEAELDRRLETWERRLAPLRGRAFVAEHKQWEYLAEWAGFRIIGYIEARPGIPPAPRHLANLAEHMRAEGTAAVIYADFWPAKAAEEMAERGGVRAIRLPASVGSRPGMTTYFDLFEAIVNDLLAVAEHG